MPIPFTIFRDEAALGYAQSLLRQRNHTGNRSDCQRFMERYVGTPHTILAKLVEAHVEIQRLRVLVENPLSDKLADELTPKGFK